jgi:hypothetical protein
MRRRVMGRFLTPFEDAAMGRALDRLDDVYAAYPEVAHPPGEQAALAEVKRLAERLAQSKEPGA